MSKSSHLVVLPADFTSPDLVDLLATHVAFCRDPSSNVPGQDQYALDLEDLKAPDVQLFCCWELPLDGQDAVEGGRLLGCAAIKTFRTGDYSWPTDDPDALEAEVKSMHTRQSERGKGIGRLLIDRVVQVAKEMGVRTLRLETGTTEAFAGSRLFYERCGFKPCGPYSKYVYQENSMFLARDVL